MVTRSNLFGASSRFLIYAACTILGQTVRNCSSHCSVALRFVDISSGHGDDALERTLRLQRPRISLPLVSRQREEHSDPKSNDFSRWTSVGGCHELSAASVGCVQKPRAPNPRARYLRNILYLFGYTKKPGSVPISPKAFQVFGRMPYCRTQLAGNVSDRVSEGNTVGAELIPFIVGRVDAA